MLACCGSVDFGPRGARPRKSPEPSARPSAEFCQLHPECAKAGLAGSCCPTSGGLTLSCCNRTATASDRGPSTPAALMARAAQRQHAAFAVHAAAFAAHAAAHTPAGSKGRAAAAAPQPARAGPAAPAAGLLGDAHSATAGARTPAAAAPVANGASPALCSAHPGCAKLGLAGNCCPTVSGTRLGCCEK